MADASDAPKPPPYRNAEAAPFVYFDFAPTFGVMTGAIQVELAARTLIPTETGGALAEVIATAHLRCSPVAARYLIDALTKALEMAEQPQQNMNASSATLN